MLQYGDDGYRIGAIAGTDLVIDDGADKLDAMCMMCSVLYKQ